MHQLSGMKSFVLSRWRGDAPLETIFWRDMIIVGTALNIITGLATIALLASGVPAAIALAVHLALLPWNIFLFLAVWRASERIDPSDALATRVMAAVWLLAVIIV
jgi:hypothetical protein